MNRNQPTIKRDMLEWVRHHVDMRWQDEYGYSTLDADPLVQLLVGACASEAKLVYDRIQETDDRLIERLLRYLLPESFHLPQPAVAIAKAQPKTTTCQLDDIQKLIYRDGEQTKSFTPLFKTTLLNGKIRFIGTDEHIFEIKEAPQYFINNKTETVSRLLLGIELPQKTKSLDGVSFYFDWKGDALEKRSLLMALSRSDWRWNEQKLHWQNGFIAADTASWEDHFNPESQLLQRVNALYRQQFAVITDETAPPTVEMPVADVLKAWLHTSPVKSTESEETTAKWATVKGNFVWLRLNLPYSIRLTDVERHLTVALNHFPVVNRRLAVKDDNDTYFDKMLGLSAFTIEPKEGLFLGIRAVLNGDTGAVIPPLSLAHLLRSRDMAYSVRYGGVGRKDDFNTWERLSYLFAMFRTEHQQRAIVDKLGDKMSLEELHEAIGARISKTEAQAANGQKTGQQPIYIFIQSGKTSGTLSAKAQYWLTDGEAANGIRAGATLTCEPPVVGLDPLSIRLVSAVQGSKNRYSTTEQTEVLQDVLFRRGRIVSAHDVKSLCRQKLGDTLKHVSLRPFFETDLNANGGVRRAIEVTLEVTKSEDVFTQQICQEIELTLQENSIGTMPYRVKLVNNQ